MAQEHNALKYFPALARLGERGFGIDDNEQSITRMSETLQGAIDLWSRPEWAIYRGEIIWSGLFTQGAVVGEQSFVGVQNPLNSQYLVGLTGVLLNNAAASDININIVANFVPTATGSPLSIDTRVPNFPNGGLATVSFAHHQAANLGGSVVAQIGVIQHQSIPIPLPVILKPGFSVYATYAAGSGNLAISATLFGWERRAFPGELLS